MVGRLVDVSADLGRVKVRAEGKVVADHARVWARSMTITDPGHLEAAARLRKAFQQPRSVASGGEDLARHFSRDLADYDRAFGLLTDDGQVS